MYHSFNSSAKKKFSTMMAMKLATKDSVQARPTPLAPEPQVKPF